MIKGICKKCCHYKSCRKPCYPVEKFLAKDNLTVWSKNDSDMHGQLIEVVFGRSREVQQSNLSRRETDEGFPILTKTEQMAFSTENGSPFACFKPKLKETGVFIDRFFHKFSYRDLAEKYDTSADNAVKTYHHAVCRVLEVVAALDSKADMKKGHYLKKVERRSGSIPKGQKWFLLNKLFGLRPSEIAELEGMNGSSSVRQLIIRVSDQLAAGEIKLTEVTPEESEAAKARLEEHRGKRRERYNRKNGDFEA